jgi:hypothetical protein
MVAESTDHITKAYKLEEADLAMDRRNLHRASLRMIHEILLALVLHRAS